MAVANGIILARQPEMARRGTIFTIAISQTTPFEREVRVETRKLHAADGSQHGHGGTEREISKPETKGQRWIDAGGDITMPQFQKHLAVVAEAEARARSDASGRGSSLRSRTSLSKSSGAPCARPSQRSSSRTPRQSTSRGTADSWFRWG
jgi:hypothetical protein